MEDAQLIGRYRLIRCISRGVAGRLWLARDELLDRDVAVKEVLFRVGLTEREGAELRERTLREAQAAAQLVHPNVVWVYDVITVEDRPWIVMQHVPSRSLHRVLTDDGPLPVDAVARIGIELVGALGAAHRAGVLHRDVTPRNVLIARDGRALLGGFGSAVIEGEAAVSQSWGITTSPQYVAPERVRDGVSSPGADLWALGATLYAAVEGRPPYRRSGLVQTLMALATDPPDRMQRAGPLARVIEGLLERDVRQRMGAAEVTRRLRKITGPMVAPSYPHARGVAPAGDPGRQRGLPDAAHDATRTLPTTWPADRTRVLGADTGSGDTTQVPPASDTPADRRTPAARLRALATADGRTGLRSAMTLVAAVAALAAGSGLAVVGAQRTLDGFHGAVTGTGGGTPVGGGQPPVGTSASTIPAAACLAPPQQPPRVVSEDASARGDRSVPPDWSWHADEEGFGIAVPPGWLRFTDGDVVCLQDPHQDRLLAVDLTVRRRTIPSDHWSAEADRLTEAGALPGYLKISIGPLIRPGGAAEWEYTWDSPDGQRQHARRLLVNGTDPGQAYALTWTTPDATWTDSESVYRVLSGSFRRSA
ncbi:serine/threonine-protein kinase [Micromonospora sp. NPDC049900]|uniref:serine/threonine-protein kinase n=1 Tax=Micromonospora sp. NPDC049900 TaxID=3364275 RepID=UPI00379A413F